VAVLTQPLGRRREWLAVLGCLSLFVLLCWWRALDHVYPFYDDVAYLAEANEIRELGGLPGLLKALFAGTYTNALRNPLYMGVLSLVAGRDLAFHQRAILLNVALAVVTALVLWRIGRRHLGERAGLLLFLFYCVSETAVHYASKESCEPLVQLFWILSVSAALDGDPEREGGRDQTAWLRAGGWAGLAWLTKGTGILLLFSLGGAALLQFRLRALREWRLYGAVATFAAAASPMIVRNLRLTGSAMHNFSNQLLWMGKLSDYSEIFAPHALETIPKGPGGYLARTPALAVLERIGLGLGETLVHLGDAMSLISPGPFGAVHLALIVIGLCCALASVWLVWRSPRGFVRTYLLVQAAGCYVFFALYNEVSSSSRFLFPMSLSLAGVLAAGLASVAEREGAWLSVPGVPRRAAVIAAAAVAASFALDTAPRTPPPGFDDAQAFLLSRLRPGETYAIDSRSRLQPLWLVPQGAKQEIVSASWKGKAVPKDDLLAWLREKGARYVIVDGSSNLSGEPRFLFYDQVKLEADGSLPLGPWPAGLSVAWADPATPRRWLVLSVD
jgi:Dolichyl-phosphate-mannose-protein mannosyltransferase